MTNPSITGNIFADNPGAGVRITDNNTTGVALHGNVICNNAAYGVDNATSTNVDATGNWWGHNAPIQSGTDYNGTVTVTPNIEATLSTFPDSVDPAGGSTVTASMTFSDGVTYTIPDGEIVGWTATGATTAAPTSTVSSGVASVQVTDDTTAGLIVTGTAPCDFTQTITVQAGRVQNLDTGEWFTTIQAAIDDSDTLDGHTIQAMPGTYDERITINKELTVRGATYNTNKNGYTVPPNYAWDDTVESIINNPDPALATSQVVDIVNTSNVTLEGFIIQSLNALPSSSNDHLVRVYAQSQGVDNVIVRNNVIGPNTNVASQNGTNGRMGLYLAMPNYNDASDITNSLFTGNTIFDCKGNGNNIFIWGGAESYNPAARGDLSGTIIEDNAIYGSHRSGIEIAGSADNLTIRDNKIYNNSGLPSDDPNNLKYGNGILIIRMGADKTSITAQGPNGMTIEDNDIYNNEKNGIYMGPINTNHTINRNNIYNNGWDGVRVDLDESYHSGSVPVYNRTSNIAANQNNIYGNTGYGAQVIGTPTNGFELNARLNWWNAANGPGGVGPGTGDEVSANIRYCPWLDAAYPGGNPTNTGGQLVTNTDTGEAFCSIQEAIDDSDTLDGHTLYATAGVYQENVVMHKALRLWTDQAASIIPASGTAVSLRSGAFPNTLTGVEIEGFTLQGTYGVQLDGGLWTGEGLRVEDLFITNCTFDNNTQEGIFIGNGTQVTNTLVMSGTFQYNNTGIGISGGTTSVAGFGISASQLTSNTLHGLQILSGVQVEGLNVTASNFAGNGNEGINMSSGAQVNGALLLLNQFTGNDIGIGINNATLEDAAISDCLIDDSGSHGIYALGGATVRNLAMMDNTIRNSTHQGIYFQNASLNQGAISGGTIESNDWGMLLRASTVYSLSVSGVTIQNNDNGSGFSAASGTVDNLNVEDCTFTNNAWEHLDLGVDWMGAVNLSNISVMSNTFGTGPWASIYIAANAAFNAGDVEIHFNDLSGPDWGVSNGTNTLADAECNWWGSITGPTHAGNTGGSGKASSDYVDYSPWSATVAADTCDYAIPTRLVFTTQPTDGSANSPLPPPPAVQAQDDEGHPGINFTDMMTVTLNSPASCGGTLSGDTTVYAVTGVVTFTNLLVDQNCQGYSLTVSAEGLAPDYSDSFDIMVRLYYLPLVVKNDISAPDLIVTDLIAAGSWVTVTIQNIGDAPSANDFWVDVYVDPNPAPSQVNQIWPNLSTQGVVWGITESLGAGDTMVLTNRPGGPNYDLYWPMHSNITSAAGLPVWAQVDAVDYTTTYGAIQELHEITGGAYNNIFDGGTGQAGPATTARPEQSGFRSWGTLPPRR